MEKSTARLTVLIDPRKKTTFEKICEEEDITPSQVIRQYIREFIEQRLGDEWKEQVFDKDN